MPVNWIDKNLQVWQKYVSNLENNLLFVDTKCLGHLWTYNIKMKLNKLALTGFRQNN